MDFIITNLIYFGVSYILVFLVYVIFINRKRKEFTEGKNQLEINYIVKKLFYWRKVSIIY